MEIDSFNARILALLKRDARLSVAAIGREIGLSRPAVQERIRTMEAAGLIRGYHAELAEAPGLVEAILFVRIAQRPCDPALHWLAGLPGVTSALSVAGEIDAIVSVSVADMAALSALNDRVAASPLVAQAHSTVVLRRFRAR